MEWRRNRQAVVSVDRIWLLDTLSCTISNSDCKLAVFAKTFGVTSSGSVRKHREIYPLPTMVAESLKPSKMANSRWVIIKHFLAYIACAPNMLYGMPLANDFPSQVNAAQRDVHARLVERTYE